MSDALKSFLFAAATCLICTLSLTAASSGLKGRQQKNIAIDRQKNILKSVGLLAETSRTTPGEIDRLYADNIQCVRVDETGAILVKNQRADRELPVYLYMKDRQIQAYVLPIDSRGLWGRILGYLALKNDGATIAGFTVYKHSETPGLGGEIEKQWFRKNFEGKKIVDHAGNFLSVSIAKGNVENVVGKDRQANYVDGISGATLTGKYLSSGLRNTLATYEPVSLKFRSRQLLHLSGKEKTCPAKE